MKFSWWKNAATYTKEASQEAMRIMVKPNIVIAEKSLCGTILSVIL